MTREQIATALEAAAYFYRAGRADVRLIEAIYDCAAGSPTMTQFNADTALLEDNAGVLAGTLS